MTHLDKLFARDVAKNRLTKDEAAAARGRVQHHRGDGTGEGGGELISKDCDLLVEVS
jgi:hypothetical protein